MVVTAVLRSVPLFANVPSEQLAKLADHAAVCRYPRGTLIMRIGENIDALYVMLAGRAKVLIPDDKGREVILAVLGHGDFFGEMALLDDQPRSASVEALDACEVLRLGRTEFLRVLRSNMDLTMRITLGLVSRLRGADRQIESLALLDVYGRVARVLLDLSEDVDGKRVVAKAPTHQQIARMIGATREMVTRVLNSLKSSGHILVSGRRIVLMSEMEVSSKRVRERARTAVDFGVASWKRGRNRATRSSA
jgi:CRP/FNR family cyclic AMP-dependent transcriptional regulator